VAHPELLRHVFDLLEVLNRVIRHTAILTNRPPDPLWSSTGRPPPLVGAEATRPHDFESWGFFCGPEGPRRRRNGRHRERAKALPRGRRRTAHGARMVARDERRHGRPEVLRPARHVAARD